MLTLENPASHLPATVASSAVLHIGKGHRLRRRGLHGLAIASEDLKKRSTVARFRLTYHEHWKKVRLRNLRTDGSRRVVNYHTPIFFVDTAENRAFELAP